MTEADIQKVYNEVRDQYTEKMQHVCSPDVPSMTQEHILLTHRLELGAARTAFRTKAKTLAADTKNIERNLTKLTEELSKHEKHFFDLNVAKTAKTVTKGKDAFYKAVQRITMGKPLCLNSLDVERVHAEGIQAAVKAFNADRVKCIGTDWDEHNLFDYLSAKFIEFQLLNTKNNKLHGFELTHKYFQGMMSKCKREPKLSIEEFNAEHERARMEVLEGFALKRNRSNRFTNDILKFNVDQYIMVQYSLLKQINKASNKAAVQQSISSYDQSALPPSALWEHCFHPDDLKKDHEDALCRALRAFRPNRTCSDGFNDSEKEELDLHLIFENRYRVLADINSIANQVAVEVGFLEFRYKFNTLANMNGNGWYSMAEGKRRECYDKAVVVGLDAFFAKRRNRKEHSADSYKKYLLARCQGYAQVNH